MMRTTWVRAYDAGVDGKSEAAAAIERARSELDEALARLADMPSLDSDRLSYAAHALSNYLMVVSTSTRLLAIAVSSRPEIDIRDRLDALNHATNLMKQLVREFLAPRGDNDPDLLFSLTDITKLVRWACDEYDPIAAVKNISIAREICSDAIMVWTDRVAVGAVLDNLLSNAVKYSAPGGTVSVHVHHSGEEGTVSITDAGPGIADAEAARLFTRGGKLSHRPTAGESSSGYGLAIAKDLIDALGGRIWFEKAATGGATFSFTLPMRA
jgi:signal transduction histidine kinase